MPWRNVHDGRLEQFQQCAEFPLLRNRGLGPLTVTILSIPLARRTATTACAAVQSAAAFFLDELGYLPFAQSGGQLISRLYERTSIIVTTILDVWRMAECLRRRQNDHGLARLDSDRDDRFRSGRFFFGSLRSDVSVVHTFDMAAQQVHSVYGVLAARQAHREDRALAWFGRHGDVVSECTLAVVQASFINRARPLLALVLERNQYPLT
jgi:hypothetical protein